MKRSEGEELVAAWQCMFAEDRAEDVGAAVKQFIATDTKGFPPPVRAITALIRPAALPEGKGRLADMRRYLARLKALGEE